MEPLENELQPHPAVNLLFSLRTESLASKQICRSVDADAWCKWGLRVLPYSVLSKLLGLAGIAKKGILPESLAKLSTRFRMAIAKSSM